MNLLSIIGAFVITLSLLSYGIGSIAIQRFKIVSRGVLIFITLGVLLDFTAILFMISGSSKGIFTVHALLGYSATLAMVIDMVLQWDSFLKYGIDTTIKKGTLLYSKIAYGWWLAVYLAGSLIIIWPN
jgi:hypothetical protein